MEKEEQKLLEQEAEMELELEQEAEETAPLVRKSRNGDDSNGHSIHSEIAGNGAQTPPAEEEQKIEDIDWLLGNESEAINGEHKRMEETDSVLENKPESTNGGHEIEETDGVLENGSEPINGNGEKNSGNLVFHDKVEGKWKCRTCTWTYGNGSVCVDHIQNHRALLHNLMSVKNLKILSEGVNPISSYICKTLILDGSVDNTKLNDSSRDLPIQSDVTSVLNNHYEEESERSTSSSSIQSTDSSSQEGVKYDLSFDIATQSNGASAINNQHEGGIEENGVSTPNVEPSSEGGTSYEPSKEIESAETDLIDEDDLEITEAEVERVIKKQKTHDLYCPNCKSCITKRVILSKRKRRVRLPAEGVKRAKPETVSLEDQVHEEGEAANLDAQVLLIEEDERERGPDIFRCLSCFSIFIPTGDGFKLFRIFGDKSGKDNVKVEQAPNVKKNWFSNMFKPNKEETVFEQASYSAIPSSDPAHQRGEPSILQDIGIHEGGDENVTLPNLRPSGNGMLTNGGRGKLDVEATETLDAKKFNVLNTDQRVESKSQGEVPSTLPVSTQVTYMENAENGISFPRKDGFKSLNNSNKEFPTLHNSEEGHKPNQIVQPRGADKDIVHHSPPVSMVEASDVHGTLNISVSVPHEEQDVTATIVTTSLLENKNVDSRSSDNGEIYPAEVPQQLVTTQTFDFHQDEPIRTGISSAVVDAPAGQGNDTRITIETHPPETQVNSVDGERSEERDGRKIEVIKSIVYGGLAESITSLSVVSSAAGGGAATLNVLAMGAANLIGGLFIICHNLWDLRSDCVEEQLSNQVTEQADRYRQLLGRRRNFALHAVVAIVSYLIFGLVSPVVYGFSFRESDDKQMKVVVVAAASLFCILMLAVGKAYVQRQPKPYLKTVTTFLILGITVSGVSYAAGGLVERLLEKFGVFEAGSTPTPNLMRPDGAGWASY